MRSDDMSCHLLAGTFAVVIQAFIGVVSLSTLVYKRFVDASRRPLEIWLMDVSKQIFSSVFIHFWNIFLSIAFTNKLDNLRLNSSNGVDVAQIRRGVVYFWVPDECSFYFLSFVFDTVLGVLLIWVLLKVTRQLAIYFRVESIRNQGYYGTPPRLTWYVQQLLCFLTVILLSKLILGMMMYSVAGTLADIGSFIFSPLRLHPNTELVVVMIVCPCFLNIVQYWLVDNFLSEIGDAGKSRERYSYLGDDDDLDGGDNNLMVERGSSAFI